jgi:hypothetical protein
MSYLLRHKETQPPFSTGKFRNFSTMFSRPGPGFPCGAQYHPFLDPHAGTERLVAIRADRFSMLRTMKQHQHPLRVA